MFRCYLIILFCFLSFTLNGQDIHFSQTTRAKYQINPAFTGAFSGNFQATINWKDQWQSINNTFRTYAASLEFTFGKGYPKMPCTFALGGYAYRDVAGDVEIGNTNAGLNFGTLLKVSHNSRLILGIQGAWGYTGLNTSAMQWGSQYNGLNYDPSLNNGEGIEYNPYNYVDFSAGLGYWFRKEDKNVNASSAQDARVGFAIYHINRPRYSFGQSEDSRLPMRFVGHLSTLLSTKWSNIYLYPNITGVMQGQQHEVLLGTLWKYRLKSASKNTGYKSEVAMIFGADVRITNVIDAVVPQLFFEFFNFSIGASYDINVSRLRNASQFRGGMELSIRFTNPDQYIHRNPFRYVPSI